MHPLTSAPDAARAQRDSIVRFVELRRRDPAFAR